MAERVVTHLILGDGAAGMAAAERIRVLAPDEPLLIVSADPRPFYYRAALTNYLLGRLSEAELDALPPERRAAFRTDRLTDTLVELRPAEHRARFEQSGWVRYREVLIATGASARRLPTPAEDPERGVPGADLEGLTVLRTLADANDVLARAEHARHAVVLGGGILGLEAAQALAELRLRVSLVHRGPTLMERVLDRTAADLVAQRVRRAGVDLRLSAQAAAFHGGRRGVTEVELDDGARLPADLVVLALGNVPNTAPWIGSTGLVTKDGCVRVDRRMRAAGAEDVFAAGDVAFFEDPSLPFSNPGGLWQPAARQGRVAGQCMVAAADGGRTPAVEYRPGAILNATRAWDLDLVTLGDHVEAGGAGAGKDADKDAGEGAEQTVRYERRADDPPVYKRVRLREGRIAGVLLLGDRRESTALQTLMNLRGAAGDVRSVADDLLRPEFDLFGWVEAQRRAPGVGRHDHEADLPRAARPRGLTQAARGLTQRSLGLGAGGKTAAFTSLPPPPLSLAVDGRPLTPRGTRVVLGGEPGADVALDDPGVREAGFTLERQGIVWMALARPRSPVALTRNGRAVLTRVPLRHGDVLGFGPHRIAVALGAEPPPPPPEPAGETAFLLGSRSRHLLRPPGARIGRDPACDVVVEHATVSAHHADLGFDAAAGAWVLSAARHDRPVSVNGEPLSGPRRLRDRDVLHLGRAQLSFGLAAPRRPDGPAAAARTQAPRKPGWLLALRGPLSGQALPLEAGDVLGRGDAASLRIDDPLLSGAHLRVEPHPGGGLALVDLGSTNGTRLAGERVEPGLPVALAEGLLLEVGRHLFRFSASLPDGQPVLAAEQPCEHAAGRTLHLEGAGWVLEQAQEGGPAAAFPLGEGLVRVGRAPHADLHLPQRDVSREHAELRLVPGAGEGAVEVTDLDSRAGTTVNGARLPPRTARRLAEGDVLSFAGRAFTLRRAAGVAAAAAQGLALGLRATLVPLDERLDLPPVPLPGLGPWIVGRQASACAALVRSETVSRTHCEIRRLGERFQVRNLSANGTRLNGEPVPDEAYAPLGDGDVLLLQDVPLRLKLTRLGGAAALPPPPDRFERGGLLAARNPLEADLGRAVERELAACIGCHECMRACPLEGAAEVTIGALNAYAREPAAATARVLSFVADCTQCHRCVPVCPADIRRSRLVLWSKLHTVPRDDQRLTLQSGEEQARSALTVGHVAGELSRHGLFGALGAADLKRLVADARLRQLEPGEELFREGDYLDALWLVWEGSLLAEVGLEEGRDGGPRRRSVVPYGPGQTVGEAALLGDAPAEATLRAQRRALLLGFTKYALTTARERAGNEAFDAALESLHVGRSREGLLARLNLPAGAAEALAAGLKPYRHAAGQVLLTRVEAEHTLGFVARGFVREVRRGLARTRVANYLKAGDIFGGPGPESPADVLVAYEAATQADTFLVTRAQVDALERRFPGTAARLLPDAVLRAEAAGRGAAADGAFTCPGGLGPLQARELLVIDTRTCVDCDNCVSACTRRHGRPRLERQNAGLQQGPFQVPASCYHCVDPTCLFCSVNGIVREPSGEIRIVEDNCIGCGACAERCPYDNIFLAPRHVERPGLVETWIARPLRRLFGRSGGRWTLATDGAEPEAGEQVAVKCDLCAGYDDGPACVRSCPTGAARRDDPALLFGVGRSHG